METNTWSIKNTTTGVTYNISKSLFKVGRNVSADLTALTGSLSRNHATLSVLIDGLLYVQDNNSCNGTFINNKRITSMEPTLLKDGDEIGFGCCQQQCTAQKLELPPLVYKVLKKSTGLPRNISMYCGPHLMDWTIAYMYQRGTMKHTFFCLPGIDLIHSDITFRDGAPKEEQINNGPISDYIVISDEEDDAGLFCNSQINKFSEKIKKEQIAVDEDPYFEIKKELQVLDHCDIVVDLTDEGNERCSNTQDLLEVLGDAYTTEDVECNSKFADEKEGNISVVHPHPQKELPLVEATPNTVVFKRRDKFSLERPKEVSVAAPLSEKVTGEKRRESATHVSARKSTHRKSEDEKKTKVPVVESNTEKKSSRVSHASEQDTSSHQNRRTLQIIEPHFEKDSTKGKKCSKTEASTSKDSSSKNNKSTVKRRSSNQDSRDRKKLKSSNDLQGTKCDNKLVIKDENKNTKLTAPKQNLQKAASNNETVLCISMPKITKNVENVNNPTKRESLLPEENPSNVKVEPRLSSLFKHVEDSKIQDTTISSNFNPRYSDKQTNSVALIDKSIDLQRPDTTFNENRIGTMFLNNRIRNIPKHITIDDDICKIVHWNVNWLEQNNPDITPPVNGELPPKSMPLKFKNFLEYLNTISPLTILELWQYVQQTLFNKDEERPPMKVFLSHKRIIGKLTHLDCECYIKDEYAKGNIIPRTDDFVIIEMKLQNQVESVVGFAYINHCKRKSANNCRFSSGKPIINLTLHMITTHCENKEIVGNQILMKVIANISSQLRLLKGLRYLDTSAICPFILAPKIQDFKITTPLDQKLIIEVNLNKEQRQIVLEACAICLGNIPRLYLIKGPPGTGKSTVIINIILQILLRSNMDNSSEPPLILLTAPSNTAVDALILKLSETREKLPEPMKKKLKMIRLGPDSSISRNVDHFKLGSLARKHILRTQRLINLDTYKEALEKGISVDEFLRKHFGHNYSYEIRCAEDVLLFNSNIICTTLNSCVSSVILDGRRRGHLKFCCCIVDEATQCTEPESLLPVQLGIQKFVLVGDPQQLPAVVCNKDAQKLKYGRSLFARIDDNFKNNVNTPVRMLYEQYRMKPEICDYPNKTFYNGKLKSFPIHVNRIQPELWPYLLFNFVGAENDNEQYKNFEEAELIHRLLETLRKNINTNCKYSIGIITPYKAQKEIVLNQISDIKFNDNVSVSVNTVDSFQGMEKDIIIISCVRYTSNHFLQNEQRLNVALTRARQALYIIGNYSLFKHCQPLYDLREDAKRRRLCIDIKDVTTNISFSRYIFKAN